MVFYNAPFKGNTYTSKGRIVAEQQSILSNRSMSEKDANTRLKSEINRQKTTFDKPVILRND